MNNTADAEPVQHTVHLDRNRNWTTEDDGAFYMPKVFFMSDGRIGMELGGYVVVKTIKDWMATCIAFERAFPNDH